MGTKTGVRQSDGTVCRTGPSCKRHGLTAGIQQQINAIKIAQASSPAKPASKKQTTHPLLQNSRLIRRGVNDPSDTTTLDALDAEADKFHESLTQEEKVAINSYSMGSFDYINRYLRQGKQGILDYIRFDYKREPNPNEVERFTGYAKKTITGLESAIDKYESSRHEPRVLYKAYRVRMPKGPTTPGDIEKYVAEHYQVGAVLTNKAYNSTTVDSDYMLAYSHRNPEEVIVHEIVSSKGVPLHKSNWRNSGGITSAEREVLLPRDTKLKVVNVTQATYESSYKDLTSTMKFFFSKAPKKKRFTVIQMVEVED